MRVREARCWAHRRRCLAPLFPQQRRPRRRRRREARHAVRGGRAAERRRMEEGGEGEEEEGEEGAAPALRLRLLPAAARLRRMRSAVHGRRVAPGGRRKAGTGRGASADSACPFCRPTQRGGAGRRSRWRHKTTLSSCVARTSSPAQGCGRRRVGMHVAERLRTVCWERCVLPKHWYSSACRVAGAFRLVSERALNEYPDWIL